MTLKDTIELMTSNDYSERFKAEYFQTKIRAEKLVTMLKKYKANELPFVPTCSYEVLAAQLAYMESYLNVLENRAKIEGIDLKEE